MTPAVHILLKDSLEGIQSEIPDFLTRMDRNPEDNFWFVEVWI